MFYWNIYRSFTSLLVIFSTITVVPLSSQPNNEVFESWGTTEFRVNRFRYTWTINNFGSYGNKFDETLSSPTFSYGIDDECKWNLEISPKRSENNSDYVSLSLIFSYSYECRHVSTQYNLGILNAKRQEINVINGTHRFAYENKTVSHDYFINQIILFREENGILANNKLTIFCEINATKSEEISGTSKQSSPSPDLQQDLADLLENPEFSDVILSAQGTEFKTFKVILSARSPVFQDIFKRDPNITRVDIVDVDPNVMNETLHYMYTDEAANMEELALDLLAVARKYELSGLQILSENALSANITVENAAELYILSDTYSEYLKTKVRNFIDYHASEVSHTQGFGSMMTSHPDLFIELFDSL